MKKVSLLLVVGLLCISLSSFAGEVITNDTDEDATGLRVVFSEQVSVTGFGDTLMEVDQEGAATEFIFSGGTLSPWGSHWLSWTPSSAQIISHEWLTSSTVALQGLPVEQLPEQPIVTGGILNPDYFSHPAYVMHGVSEKDAIFAMPLDGIEELKLYPTIDGVDLENITWSVEVNHPKGIGAKIEHRMLYIWGSNASWAGYGEVTLKAVLGDTASSVSIPVTVFRDDKTLINAEGKKDYFVPWSPELDINRILSVEEHMRKYNKDEGNLDRSIQWSRWKKMEQLKDVDTHMFWSDIGYGDGRIPQDTQFALVDVYLAELVRLGFNAFRTYNSYFISDKHATDIHKLFLNTQNTQGSPSKTPEEEAYVINEGHRLGLSVLAGNIVILADALPGGLNKELYCAYPKPLSEFIDNYLLMNSASLKMYTQLGVDIVDAANAVSSMYESDCSFSEATELNEGMIRLAENARIDYAGPIYNSAIIYQVFFPGVSVFKAPFWDYFDILGQSVWGLILTDYKAPTVPQLIKGWDRFIDEHFQPFQAQQNKPLMLNDNGTNSVTGSARYALMCSFMPFFDANNIDIQEMADYYLAQSIAFEDMEGYFGPGWSYFVLKQGDRGGVRDPSFTFRLKIEDLLQSINLGKSDPRIIQIDAEFDDWLEDYIVFSDPAGDATGPEDIISLAFTQDEDYFYFKVEYSTPPSNFGFLLMAFDTNGDNREDFKLFSNNYWTDLNDWKSQLWRNNTIIGFSDSIDNENQIELRIAKRYIEPYLGDSLILLNLKHTSINWEISDETGKIYLEAYQQNSGKVITNDTGEDATGLRVVFSTPVKITAFGDALTDVDQEGPTDEFVFTGGTVAVWGSHWLNWTTASAKIISHEWLHSIRPAINKSTLDLPTTTLTQFPPSVVQAELAAVDTETPYYVLPVEQYFLQDELPVDGMSSGSVPLNWWYSFDQTENGPKFHGIEPIQKDGERFVQYTYPDDGDVRTLSSQFTNIVDASSYEALVVVARADHAINAEIGLDYYDHNLPATEDDALCGSSCAVFPAEIPLDQQERVYILPLAAFHVNPWEIEHKPGTSADPNLGELLEFKITPNDEGTIEILRVAFAKTMPTAVTTGNSPEINEYYFQQPAYVMQGVNELESVYALPLKGIPELGTGCAAEDPDGGELTWSVTTSDPGIGAGFQDERLYIWGADANWPGYGEVTLTVTDAEGMSDSIAIPVTVFRDDKTLINAEGKKDYFVPWSSRLDVNRIRSVEAHMLKYKLEDMGLLDRSIRFSPWRLMEHLNDATKSQRWSNEERSNGWWNQRAQFLLTTMFMQELQEIGFNAIRIVNPFFVRGLTGSTIYPVYDFDICTMTAEEEAYIINEAHRFGLKVLASNWIGVDWRQKYLEIWQVCPSDLDIFWASYQDIMVSSLRTWTQLGVDIAAIGEDVEVVCAQTSIDTLTDSKLRITNLAQEARHYFPGPLTYFAPNIYGPPYDWDNAEFWQYLDILCAGNGVSGHTPLTPTATPTYEELVEGWKVLVKKHLAPFQHKWNKPLLTREIGCYSVKGAAQLGSYFQLEHPGLVLQSRIDLEEQVRYYSSFFDAIETFDDLFGFGAYRYEFVHYNIGGINDTSWVPRLKPVEEIFELQFKGFTEPAALRIDGVKNDWDESFRVIEDTPADSQTGQDEILGVLARKQDGYLFFFVEYAAAPNGNMSVELDWNSDLVADCFITTTWLRSPACWNSFVGLAGEAQPICVADAASGSDGMEIRVNKELLGLPDGPYSVRISDSSRNWSKLDDETDWACFPEAECNSRSALMRTEHGYLTEEVSQVISGVNSVIGRSDGRARYLPYLRTNPLRLHLMPNHSYRVCFDYHIIQTSPEGFEVLFYSPTGAREGNWVTSLRIKGIDGTSGHACLEGQLYDYPDYEIRWNVVSSGKIVIDNVVVRDLVTDQIIAEEDFEDWR